MTDGVVRGNQSKIILDGRCSYGIENIVVRSWREGANLYIGNFCSIANGVTVFLGGNHRTDWSTTYPFGHIYNDEFPAGCVNGAFHPATKGHVVIENDVWIGSNSTIMSGVRIGSGSVLAAGSVVVKDVEPYAIVGGNPARFLKYRFSADLIELLLEIQWWNYSDEAINSVVPLLQQPPSIEVLSDVRSLLLRSSDS